MDGIARGLPEPAELLAQDLPEVTPEQFAEAVGESVQDALNLDRWSEGADLIGLYDRTEAEVRAAVAQEDSHRKAIRQVVFPLLAENGPQGAGVYQAALDDLERIHRGLLFSGGVEASDGTQQVVDTLPLTVFQIGVSLVSYQGHQGTLGQRLFRRDLRLAEGDPTSALIELLKRRGQRGGLNQPSRRDALSELLRRGLTAYAERAILLRCSRTTWRMGHGNPAPYELLTGSGSLDLMIESTKVIRELVEDHQRFVFVASEPGDRLLLTIGQALRPLEFAIVCTLREMIERIVAQGHYRGAVRSETTWDGVRLTPAEWIVRFRDAVAPQVVVGVYRATRLAPAQLFYAHVDHADLAAHIAIADSMLQEHRGFPLLIDLAHSVCGAVFGGDTLRAPVSTGYADAGAPFRYFSERTTRRM